MTAPAESFTTLKPEFVDLRNKGWSYREIGEKYGLSHERVRQIIGPDATSPRAWHDRKRKTRQARTEEISAWLEAEGPVARNRVMETWDLTTNQINDMVARREIPAHLILLPERERPDDFSTEDILDALRRAWANYSSSHPDSSGMSHVSYDRVRRTDDPSPALVNTRLGWETACEMAEVPSGPATRPKVTYASAWSDDDLLRHVAEYIEFCKEHKQRATYLGYEDWQRMFGGAHPSGTTIRNRMRQRDEPLMKWHEIVTAAMRLG